MKRSAPMQRKTPLARTGFKRKEPGVFKAQLDRNTATLVRKSAMKSRPKRATVADGANYLAACRGERCYLNVFGVCLHDRATVVPCHSNQRKHGKGMGIKAKHEFTVPGCRACHAFIDQGNAPREFKFSAWDRAYAEWEPVRVRKMGLEMQEAAQCSCS